MDTCAFIIHPIDPKWDVSRKFPLLFRILNEKQIDFFSTFFPPVYISEIEEITSQATGKEIKGWFIACPYTPRRMMELSERTVYRKIIQTGKLAEKLGADILGEVQLILTVTSAIHDVIRPEYLQPGSVVCDVARPRDVSAMVAAARDDILVIDGGMVDVPGPVNFHFNFGFPPGKAYACMAETIALALEGRFEDYTLGKHLTRARVEEINRIAKKHGFHLSGFRSFEREVTPQHIETVSRNA